MSKDKTIPIVIIGAGAWGLSTAYHLTNQGYTNITVFDRASEIPSPYSAAYDLNKIVRAEYEDEFYTQLALVSSRPAGRYCAHFDFLILFHELYQLTRANPQEAIEGWKTPLFAPYYHQTGYIIATSSRAPSKSVNSLQKALKSVSTHPNFASGIKALNSREDFRDYAWQVSGPLRGFRGYFNRLAGYAHSANALKGVYTFLAGRGVRFHLGEDAGKVVELIYDSTSRGRKCIGLRTADGAAHHFSTTICALGAYGVSLVPEVGRGYRTVSRCWSVAHIRLSEAECDFLRGIPVINVRDLGFFFEPDPATKLFKLCPLGAGYTNPDRKSKVSSHPEDSGDTALAQGQQDFIPIEDERKLRQLLRETFPWMADRPFVDKKMCWFNDSKDSEYLIDFAPGTVENSLVVLAGDSGHGFKMMPIFGKWVVQLLETGEQQREGWKWNHKGAEELDEKADDWGTEVSWRIGKARTLREAVEERGEALKARL